MTNSALLLFVCMFWLAGCSPFASRFSVAPSPGEGRTLDEGISVEIETLIDPDFIVPYQFKVALHYVNADNQLEGKYVLKHLERRLRARGFILGEEKPEFAVTVWASEKPFSYWVPGYSYFVPVYSPGNTTTTNATIQNSWGMSVGSVAGTSTSEGAWGSQRFDVPGKVEKANGRFIIVQVFRISDLRKGSTVPIWEGKVTSAGSGRLMDVYGTMVSELSDEFPNPTRRGRKRMVPLEEAFDRPFQVDLSR